MEVNHANMWDPLAGPLALQTSGDDFQRERVIQRMGSVLPEFMVVRRHGCALHLKKQA
jgi:hypothetical protein